MSGTTNIQDEILAVYKKKVNLVQSETIEIVRTIERKNAFVKQQKLLQKLHKDDPKTLTQRRQ